jgi:formate dehydrogenase subunit delta
MNRDHLIHMANQIGVFFESMPDHAEAVEGIATHLKNFWDPRMRREFLQLVDSDGSAGINAMVLEAMHQYRAMLA